MSFEIGNRVLAPLDGGRRYPARVNGSERGLFVIVFDRGDVTRLPAEEIEPLRWAVGTRVDVNWDGRGEYFPAEIEMRDRDLLFVHYDDGDEEVTSIGRCRELVE